VVTGGAITVSVVVTVGVGADCAAAEPGRTTAELAATAIVVAAVTRERTRAWMGLDV